MSFTYLPVRFVVTRGCLKIGSGLHYFSVLGLGIILLRFS